MRRHFLILLLLWTVPLQGWALAAMPACPGLALAPAAAAFAATARPATAALAASARPAVAALATPTCHRTGQGTAPPGAPSHEHSGADCKLCAGCAGVAAALPALAWPTALGFAQAWPPARFAPRVSVVPRAPEPPPRRPLA